MKDPALHVRKMKPPVRERIEELALVLDESPAEDFFERDEKTGVLIRVGRTEAGGVVRYAPTGKMVESFETATDDGLGSVFHEGSMKAVDVDCKDCGNDLAGGGRQDFYYLACIRIDTRDRRLFVKCKRPTEVQRADGSTVTEERWQMVEFQAPPLFEDCVLECGGVN